MARRRVRPPSVSEIPTLAEVLDSVRRLAYGDLLRLYRELGAYLDEGPGRPTDVAKQAERQSEAFAALQAAVAYLRERDPDRGPEITVDEFRAVPTEHRLGWSATAVIRAFESWRNAANAATSGLVWKTAAQRARRRAWLRSPEAHPVRHLDGVRVWLKQADDARDERAYDDWVAREAERGIQRVSARSIRHAHNLRDWDEARHLAEHPEIDPAAYAAERAIEHGQAGGPLPLISGTDVAALLGVSFKTVNIKARNRSKGGLYLSPASTTCRRGCLKTSSATATKARLRSGRLCVCSLNSCRDEVAGIVAMTPQGSSAPSVPTATTTHQCQRGASDALPSGGAARSRRGRSSTPTSSDADAPAVARHAQPPEMPSRR